MTTENNAPAPTPTAPAELPMAEYAAAVNSGKNPIVSAAAPAPTPTAESTEGEIHAAESTEDEGTEGKTPTASATEDDPEKLIEESHPAKKGINKRFSELTKEKKGLQALADARQAEVDTAKREAEQAKEDLERMRADAEKAAQAAIPLVAKVEDDPKPSRDDFSDPDEYVIAASAYAAREELRKANVAASEAAQARATEAEKAHQEARRQHALNQIENLNKSFQENQTRDKVVYPDYDEKVMQNADLQLAHSLFFAIQKSPDSAHLLYHLASNPDVAKKLNGMDQVDAALQLGELQAELRIARKPKPTKAATPIKPVGNRESPQAKTPHEESMAEFAARREKEMQQEADLKRPKRAGNR